MLLYCPSYTMKSTMARSEFSSCSLIRDERTVSRIMQDYRWIEFQRNLSILTNSFYCLTADDKPQGISAMRECLAHMQSALKQQLCSDGMRTVAAMAESLIQETYGISSGIPQSVDSTRMNSDVDEADVFLINQNNVVILNDVNFHQSSNQDSNSSFATITLDAPPACPSTSSLLNGIDSSMDICCATNPIYETLKNARCHLPQIADGFVTDFDNYERGLTDTHNTDNGTQLGEAWDFTSKMPNSNNSKMIRSEIPTMIDCSLKERCPQNLIPLLRCEKCEFTTPYRQSMHRHAKLHISPNLAKSNNSCCNKSNSVLEISDHQAQENIRKYPCSHCDKRFKTRSSLNEHCSYVHPQRGTLTNDSNALEGANGDFNRRFVCEECTKSFPLKKDLNRHTRVTHSDARPFQCHCGKAYKTKYHLTRHESTTRHILISS